jgi:ribosome modulation factor
MKDFKFFRQTIQPNIPERYRNNVHKSAAFVEGWEAAKRGEHAIRTRYGIGNPYIHYPLKNIWLYGWRDYLANTSFDTWQN